MGGCGLAETAIVSARRIEKVLPSLACTDGRPVFKRLGEGAKH